jgi:RNA polymerase sigma-70 factor, ECF subfamily
VPIDVSDDPVPPGTAVEDPEREAQDALARGSPEEALAALMRSYGVGLFRFCRQMMADSDLAQDVFQTTWLQAFEALTGFKMRSSFRTWLFSIARHRCLDATKTSRRREKRITFPGELPEAPAPDPAAEMRLGERDRRLALRRCLEELAPKVRSAVLLRYQEEFSYQGMAGISGERAATLQARVARALPVLRSCLEAQGFG